MNLHEKIYYCRKKAGLSQEALAEKLNVSRQAVSKWETGDAVPEIPKLSALAKVFGVTADWLISDDDPEETGEKETISNEDASERHDPMKPYLGVIGRLIKRYGWLLGVYISGVGALFTAIGALMRFVVKKMFTATVNDFFAGSHYVAD